MLKDTESKKVGGALFNNNDRPYWLAILPHHCRAARWQRMGGADFLLRRVKQQSATRPKERDPEERETLATEIASLMEQGVYEEVPQTLEEEEKFREYVKSGQWDAQFRQSRLKARSSNPRGAEIRYSSHKSKKSNSLIQFGSDLGVAVKNKREKRERQQRTKRDTEVQHEANSGLQAQIFYSELWLKVEADKARALADLKHSGANKHARTTKTKQEGVRDLKSLITPGCRFSKWDLRKAFFQILLQARLRSMLRTWVQLRRKGKWGWVRIQNTGLSQGLATSPEIITKLFADVLRVLRQLGIKCLIKVDDLIAVLPEAVEEAMMQTYVITVVLVKLGAVVSSEKCDLGLRHRIEWHGMVFCSVVEVCSVPAQKVTKVVQVVSMFLRVVTGEDGVITVRALQQLIGLLVSNMEAVQLTRVMCIELQELRAHLVHNKGWNWKDNGDEQIAVTSVPVKLLKMVRIACGEWVREYDQNNPTQMHWNGKLCYSEPPIAVIYTDACPWQAGVYTQADPANGHPAVEKSIPFVGAEIGDHITLQETAAAADGVLEVLKERNYRDCSVLVKIDATAALKYIACQGGRIAKFGRRVWELVQYCQSMHIMMLAGHITGKLNVSDWKSRVLLGVAEYKLERSLFETMRQLWGPFGLDACAAKWNNQLPRYLSRQLSDSEAVGHNILDFPLQHETKTVWMFPPPHMRLIMEIIQRVVAAEAGAVLVMPAWPSIALTEAVQWLAEMPVVLECNSKLLQPPLSYLLHAKVREGGKQWYAQKQWKAFTGLRLSAQPKNKGAFAKSWRETRQQSTNAEPTESEVRTMIGRSHSLWPGSERSTEPARLILRTLLYAT